MKSWLPFAAKLCVKSSYIDVGLLLKMAINDTSAVSLTRKWDYFLSDL